MKRNKFSNRVVSVLCTLALFVTLVLSSGDVPVVMAAEGDIAWNQFATVFPDADVQAAVLDELGITNLVAGDVITQDALNTITYLDISKSSGALNLQGLERLTKLGTLSLDGEIQSLAPLNNLTNLKELCIDNVDGELSFTQMANVSSLTEISFYNCDGIKSLDGLEKNVGMDSIQIISCDNLTDISACSAFTSLTYASFYTSDSLEDISSLAGINTLKSVDIGNTSVKDISALSGKTSITSLGMQTSGAFGDNADASCQVLSTLTNLKSLCLRSSDIDDAIFAKLCNMTSLELLDLLYNDITSLSPVTKLTNLTVLDIGDNKISNFTPLASLPNLKGSYCCNVGQKSQYVVVNGPSRTIPNPFVAMDGSVIVPTQSGDFTYNAADNTITFIGDDWQYSNEVGTVQMNYNGNTFDMKLYIKYANVVDDITITTQPKATSVDEDEKVTLSVVAESFDDNFRYQWYKDGEKLSGETKDTLTIDKAASDDAGLYKCVVSNATASATSNEVKVEIKGEEVTTQAPTTQEPTTQAPTTQEPTTQAPTTQAPSTGSTTDVTPEDNTTAAPATTEATNNDSAVTTGDTANPMTAVMVLLLALTGMIFVGRAYRYKEQ